MTSDNKASTSKPAAKPKPSNFCVQLHRRVGIIPLVLFIQLRSLARVLTNTPLWSRSLLENPRDPENLRWVDGQMDQFQICVNEENALAALRPTLDFKSYAACPLLSDHWILMLTRVRFQNELLCPTVEVCRTEKAFSALELSLTQAVSRSTSYYDFK